MQELITQLLRLYLPPGAPIPDGLEQHLEGRTTLDFALAANGATRAMVIPFEPGAERGDADSWQRLCGLAHALQDELGLPAPAVSVSGISGFRLWLSFAQPLPVARAQALYDLLRARYPALILTACSVDTPVQLPPCLQPASGKWAAFINPGMGASFADEPALEMAPPAIAQAAFLEGLDAISSRELEHAMGILQGSRGALLPQVVSHAPARVLNLATASVSPAAGVPDGLLLRDATLEDIVRHLHAMNIEPTFRHVLPPR